MEVAPGTVGDRGHVERPLAPGLGDVVGCGEGRDNPSFVKYASDPAVRLRRRHILSNSTHFPWLSVNTLLCEACGCHFARDNWKKPDTQKA